ncbi:hypothetical protein RI367_005723 [Sorochytrium milnesiophthora]
MPLSPPRSASSSLEHVAQQDDLADLPRFPKSVFFIVGNEFCERFTFYGIRAVLFVFLTGYLHFSADTATALQHTFIMSAYFCTLIGGVISDSYLGKFRTIVYLSLVYSVGNIVLSITSIPGVTGSTNPHWWGAALGLALLAFGTGGIKPCVSAFGGDQFHPSQTKEIAAFFSMFYFAVNSGSMLSTIVTPILRNNFHCFGRQDCFPLAFGIPSILMLVSTLIFIAGYRSYKLQPPTGNILKQVYLVWYEAAFNRRRYAHAFRRVQRTGTSGEAVYGRVSTGQEQQPDTTTSTTSLTSSRAGPTLGHRRSDTSGHDRVTTSVDDDDNSEHERLVADLANYAQPNSFFHYALLRNRFQPRFVEDVRQLFNVLRVFIPLPIFWTLFDQQSSRWTLQAQKMGPYMSLFGYRITIFPEQMQVTNAILILLFIPLFQNLVYPLMTRLRVPMKPLQRIAIGMTLAGLSFVVAALLQLRIDATMVPSTTAGGPSVTCGDRCVPILWQLPQYVIMTAGEIMVSITGLEFAYSQAPASLKSVCQAAWQLTVAIGNLVVIIIAESHFFSAAPEFFFFAGLIFAAVLLFLYLSAGWVYVSDPSAHLVDDDGRPHDEEHVAIATPYEDPAAESDLLQVPSGGSAAQHASQDHLQNDSIYRVMSGKRDKRRAAGARRSVASDTFNESLQDESQQEQ